MKVFLDPLFPENEYGGKIEIKNKKRGKSPEIIKE
jgi:hypothetical protein